MTFKPPKVQEPTEYKCPKCGGMILKVTYNFPTHQWWRWTCEDCDRDYGYNTEKPRGVAPHA